MTINDRVEDIDTALYQIRVCRDGNWTLYLRINERRMFIAHNHNLKKLYFLGGGKHRAASLFNKLVVNSDLPKHIHRIAS